MAQETYACDLAPSDKLHVEPSWDGADKTMLMFFRGGDPLGSVHLTKCDTKALADDLYRRLGLTPLVDLSALADKVIAAQGDLVVAEAHLQSVRATSARTLEHANLGYEAAHKATEEAERAYQAAGGNLLALFLERSGKATI